MIALRVGSMKSLVASPLPEVSGVVVGRHGMRIDAYAVKGVLWKLELDRVLVAVRGIAAAG